MKQKYLPPATAATPVAQDIVQRTFVAICDGTEQSYLLKDFRPSPERDDASLLVIYLHGASADQRQGMTAGIYGDAFGRLAVELEQRKALYVCPEYRGGSWMGEAAEADLKQLIGILRAQYNPRKLILLGGSMGGTSALIFASRHAEQLDGVIALCPATDVAEMFAGFSHQFLESYGGSPTDFPERYLARSARHNISLLAQLPVVLVHGSDDKVIPVAHSRILVEQLRELRARVSYLEIEGGDHDAPLSLSWPQSFDFVLGRQPF